MPYTKLMCVCGECGRQFRLLMDDYLREPDEMAANIRIQSCDSGGMYGAQVECPHCNHRHELY